MSSWGEWYKKSTELVQSSVDVLTAFNANIDVVHSVSDLKFDLAETDPELFQKPSSMEELKASINYCIQNGENNEVDLGEMEIDQEGKEFIGGQAGIISNFLSSTGNGVIFYTPLLSEELSSEIDEKVLYPVIDGDFMLKNVRDASNTDRTKRNHIFEFNQDGNTGRLIVSDTLKGFGPYFRKGVEDNLDLIQESIDCAIFSGFHDIEGNKEAKLKKSAQQLRQIEKPVHLEYVDKNREVTLLIVKHVLPEVDSLGLDESEFKGLLQILDIDENAEGEKVNLGKAFNASRQIIERFDLERIHLHTYRYHLTVTPEDYPRSKQRIRKSMLYGEVAAIQAADKGRIPDGEDIKDFRTEDKKIEGLHELEHFGNFFDKPEFRKSGTAEIEGFNVVAIPTIIHPDPEKTVGMGDIISSGAFSSEFS